MTKHQALCTVVAGSLLLAGCGQDESPGEPEIIGPTWQITDIFTDPAMPSALPSAATGQVSIAFGTHSAALKTGCAPGQAIIAFDENQQAVTFNEVELAEPTPDCINQSIHDELVSLLSPGTKFTISWRSDSEVSLTEVRDDILDAPALRLVVL